MGGINQALDSSVASQFLQSSIVVIKECVHQCCLLWSYCYHRPLNCFEFGDACIYHSHGSTFTSPGSILRTQAGRRSLDI